MATTKKFYVTKDAVIANRISDGWDAGKGTSTGLAFGLYQGYRYRILLGFAINMTGWTSITSATLWYRTSNQISVAFGSDPTIKFQRISTSWSEGSSSGLSASNSVIYPGPTRVSTNEITRDLPTGESTWGSAPITAMMRDVLNGSPFYGIAGLGVDNTGSETGSTSAHVGEFYSREQGSDIYIEITYETNRAPTVTPSLVGAVNSITADTTPDIQLVIVDPDGDDIASYTIDVDDADDVTSPFLTQTVTGPWATPTTQLFTMPTPLARNVLYYVRVSALDSKGAKSSYATLYDWKIAQLPVVTLTEPSAGGRIAKVSYDAGSGWASPRLNVTWTFSCPDGGTQKSYRVEVFADNAGALGALLDDSLVQTDAAARLKVMPGTLTESGYYHVRVTCVCSHNASTTSAVYRTRVHWGVSTHRYDLVSTPSTMTVSVLDTTDSKTGGSGLAVLEYATKPDLTAVTAWASNIASAGVARYFWYRVWLLTWGASPTVSPTLNELKIGYDATVIVPDVWTRTDPPNETGDSATFVYGTKSMRLVGTGATHRVWQRIAVAQKTDYVLSGRIQSQGASGAYIDVADSATATTSFIATTPVAVTRGFDDELSRVWTTVWNSGERSEVWVRCTVTGPASTPTVPVAAWFDALKLEASAVVTPWSPGLIANAVVIDSGGISVDGYAGGIFRLRGSLGGGRDEINLGPHGLQFGQPGSAVELYSPAAGVLTVDGVSIQTGPNKGWRFVRVPLVTVVNNVTSTGVELTLELPQLPANDPTVVAAWMAAMVRDPTATNNYSFTVKDYDGNTALLGYTSGSANRGGSFGPGVVMVGGTNNRQMKYTATSGAAMYLYIMGYWVVDP